MSQTPIFTRAGGTLLEHLRSELVPVVLGAPDMIQLAYPGWEEEFRLGLFLYGTEEVRPNGPPGMTRLGPDSRRMPDLALALHFMAFANRKVSFRGMCMEDEFTLVEGVMRAVHGSGGLNVDGRRVNLEFHDLTQSEKVSLWQSLNAPLQPAAYLTLEPILLPSDRIRKVPPVRAVDIHTSRKGGGA